MTNPIKSLAARHYTDPQVFRAETAGLLAQTWQYGCHVSELANVGDYATFEIAGESLFAIRGRDEKIGSFTTFASTERISWSAARAAPALSSAPTTLGPTS